MNKDEFRKLANLTEEKKLWLECVKETSLAHMRWAEVQDELTHDDEGLLIIEQAFLYLYGIAQLHGLLDKGETLQ